jgi:putative transposase
MKQSHAAKELLRDKSWATIWLRRFDEEGLDGLRDRPRSGRPPKADEKTLLRVKRTVDKLAEGVQVGWVRELIRRKAKVTYSTMQVYRILHGWGYGRVVPEKSFVNKAPKEERELFKKGQRGFSRTSQKGSP